MTNTDKAFDEILKSYGEAYMFQKRIVSSETLGSVGKQTKARLKALLNSEVEKAVVAAESGLSLEIPATMDSIQIKAWSKGGEEWTSHIYDHNATPTHIKQARSAQLNQGEKNEGL